MKRSRRNTLLLTSIAVLFVTKHTNPWLFQKSISFMPSRLRLLSLLTLVFVVRGACLWWSVVTGCQSWSLLALCFSLAYLLRCAFLVLTFCAMLLSCLPFALLLQVPVTNFVCVWGCRVIDSRSVLRPVLRTCNIRTFPRTFDA